MQSGLPAARHLRHGLLANYSDVVNKSHSISFTLMAAGDFP